jgi:hypothetical protein
MTPTVMIVVLVAAVKRGNFFVRGLDTRAAAGF